MKRRLFGAAFGAISLAAAGSQAAIFQFNLTGTEQSGDETVEIEMRLDTTAPLLNAPSSETQAHEFGAAGLSSFSLTRKDAGGNVLNNIMLSGMSENLISVTQNRAPGQAGSNVLGVDLNALNLTGVVTTTGFLNVNLTSIDFLAFDTGSPNFVADLLFDDPAVLLSNIQLMPIPEGGGAPQALDRNNFALAGDPSVFGVNSSIIGNFLFNTVSIFEVVDNQDPNVGAVPLPAPALLLLTALGGLFGLSRRKQRKAA